MDALSALASIAGSNAIAGIGAPASASGSQGPDPSLPITPPASVSVFLSDFAQSLLAQQASDPTLDIDTAFARSVLGLSQDSANDGQLFTSSGLLQPFSAALLPPQVADTSTTGSTDGPIPDPNTVGIPEQAVLTSEESLLNIQNDATSQTSAAVTVNTPVSTPAVTPAATQAPVVSTAPTTDTTEQTTATDVAAPATVQPAASTPIATADNGIVIPSAAAQDQTTSNLDPFQQAALIGGLTSFGKEQHSFIPAASDNDQSFVRGVAAIMPVGPRNQDSTEAWLGARR